MDGRTSTEVLTASKGNAGGKGDHPNFVTSSRAIAASSSSSSSEVGPTSPSTGSANAFCVDDISGSSVDRIIHPCISSPSWCIRCS